MDIRICAPPGTLTISGLPQRLDTYTRDREVCVACTGELRWAELVYQVLDEDELVWYAHEMCLNRGYRLQSQ